MSEKVVLALIGIGGVAIAQFGGYLVSRQNTNDLRVNIDREIGIIRKLQSGSAEVSKLEAHVSASVDKLIYRDERRERLFDVTRKVAPLMLVGSALLGLAVWRLHGVPANLGAAITVLYYLLVATSGWLLGDYLWGLLKFAYFYTRLGAKWTQIGGLKLKHWWLQHRLARGKQRLEAVLGIVEDLADAADIAAAEQASGDDEKARATMEVATDTLFQRLAGIGVTLKNSRPLRYY